MCIHEIINKRDDAGNFMLSPLPYTDDHLEPYIGERTVRFHYWKHLQAYINKVNNLKKNDGSLSDNATIEDIIRETSYGDLFNNASQVFNHYFYFEQLGFNGALLPLPKTQALGEKHYGSWDNLKAKIIEDGMSIFGSGWVFLTTDTHRENLWIRTFVGTGTPLAEIPLLALDVWEHAYYLDYQNDRRTYMENLFNTINWEIVENRLTKDKSLEKI